MAAQPSTTKRMILMFAVSIIVFGLIFGYKAVGNYFMNDFFDNMPAPTVTITAAEVEQQTWRESVTTIGNFAAVNGTMLSVQVPGVITEIHFANGDEVQQGDVLFSLDTDIDVAELERLQAQLDIATLEAARLQRLAQSESISASELARAESEVAQVRAALAAQQALLQQKTIRAPFSGALGIRRVNLGEYVAPGTQLVSLQSKAPIFLNFSLAERYRGQLNLEQTLVARVDSYLDHEFSGEITAIAPDISDTTRSVAVQATFNNSENRLKPGMFARVELAINAPREVLVIPRTAVQFNPFGNVVYLLEEKDGELIANQQLIRTGQVQGDLIEVTDGIQAGDRVASSGLLKLRNNAVVKINDDPSLQPPAERNPRPVNE